MNALTAKQENIVRFIGDFTRRNGGQPSYREIAEGCQITVGTVQHYVRALAKKGVLEPPSYRARCLRLASAPPLRGLSGAGIRGYAILGGVPAGKPNLIYEEVEDTLWLDERLCRSRDAYLLRVKGDSMIGAGILDGDLVVVRPQKTADPGEIVVTRTPEAKARSRLSGRRPAAISCSRRTPDTPRFMAISTWSGRS